MRKKVALINPPGDKLYLRDCYCSSVTKSGYYWHPLDLLIQSGILSEDLGVSVLDANVLNLSKDESLRRISNMRPDAVLMLMGDESWGAELIDKSHVR